MVMEIRGIGDRVMAVVLVFEGDVLNLICGYALLSGRCLDKNQSFMMN